MAHDVFCWWIAGASAGVGSSWRNRAAALAAKRRSDSLLADLAAIRDAFFQRNAPPNNSEFLVHAGFHLRPVGRNGVRSRRGDCACGNGGQGWTTGGAARFAGDHACFFCDDSGLPGDAAARGKTRPSRGTGLFLRADVRFHRAHVWKGFLPRSRSSLVLLLPFLSGL